MAIAILQNKEEVKKEDVKRNKTSIGTVYYIYNKHDSKVEYLF